MPDANSGQAACLLAVIFPTDYLGRGYNATEKKVRWLKPAPKGQTLAIEVLLTYENKAAVERQFAAAGVRDLVVWGSLRNGSNVLLSSLVIECGPVTVQVPREPIVPGQVIGALEFPDTNPMDPNRPVRMVMKLRNSYSDCQQQVWEL